MAESGVRTARAARKGVENLKGLGYSLISGASFQSLNGFIRMASETMHPFEIAFFRNLIGLAVLAPLILRHGLSTFRTRRFPMHCLRAGLNLIAMLSAFWAVTIAPLAKVAALYLTAPLFASIGAILILGERPSAARIAVLAAGFVGAMVILRPGVDEITLGTVLATGSAISWAAALLVIKHLSRTETSLTITSYAALLLAPMALLASLYFWTWPSWMDFGWLIGVGFCGAAAQLTLAQAFRHADATLVLSADFAKLIWASVIGYAFFAEVPEAATWAGGLIVVASVTYLAQHERRARHS